MGGYFVENMLDASKSRDLLSLWGSVMDKKVGIWIHESCMQETLSSCVWSEDGEEKGLSRAIIDTLFGTDVQVASTPVCLWETSFCEYALLLSERGLSFLRRQGADSLSLRNPWEQLWNEMIYSLNQLNP